MAMAVEALCAAGGGWTPSQMFLCTPIFGGITLTKFGSAEVEQALLPGLCNGNVRFAMALTEPDAGTNTLALRSFARPDGNGWRLNGQKIWITAVPQATKLLVIARTKKAEEVSRKTDGISLFMIDVER